MEFETKSKVYIQVDSDGRILRCEGGYTTPVDLAGWQEIDEGNGDRYNLCQSHYFDGGLYPVDRIHRYRGDGWVAALRTEEDLAADRSAIPEPEPSGTLEGRLTALEAEAEQAKADREALNILLGGAE